MESKALNSAYKLSGARKGVLVKHVMPLVDAEHKMKRGDILMKFDGIQIASDGTVPFRWDHPLATRLLGLSPGQLAVSKRCICSCAAVGLHQYRMHSDWLLAGKEKG